MPLMNGTFANIEDILKASKNIIDLIEVGDYVNGILIESIYEKTNDYLFFHTFNEEFMFQITNDNIKNIVTKEQFNAVKYDVEG